MKFKVLTSLVVLGGAVAIVGAGCGDDTSVTGGGGTGEGGDPAGGAPEGGANPVTNSTTTMSGGGGATGDGNDTIATADPLEEMEGVSGIQGDLDPAEGDIDFYSFNGVAGPVWISSDAKPNEDPFAAGFVDLVVTLYNADGDQIAQNDDPFPTTTQDSNFYTILPADGTYYLSVEEFCSFSTCDDPDYFENLTETQYAVNVITLDPNDPEDGIVPEPTEPNETEANAAVMEYAAREDVGVYYLSLAYGEWQSANDTDAVLFTVPADLTVTPGSRGTASIVPPPPGVDGNGSTTNPGLITIVNVAAPTVVVARFDMSNETNGVQERASMDFPVTPGATYMLTVTDGPPADGGSGPFYFLLHSVGSGNPVETQEAVNNLPGTPEALDQAMMQDSFFIEGNLADGDEDYFTVPVLDETVTVVCGSLRSGSGATGFTATVFQDNGTTPIPDGSATETAASGGDLAILDLPTGANTDLVIKFEKGVQDPTNPANYYRCGIHFAPAE